MSLRNSTAISNLYSCRHWRLHWSMLRSLMDIDNTLHASLLPTEGTYLELASVFPVFPNDFLCIWIYTDILLEQKMAQVQYPLDVPFLLNFVLLLVVFFLLIYWQHIMGKLDWKIFFTIFEICLISLISRKLLHLFSKFYWTIMIMAILMINRLSICKFNFLIQNRKY